MTTSFEIHFEKPTVVHSLMYLVFFQVLFSLGLVVAFLMDLPLSSPVLLLYWITNFWHVLLSILGYDVSEKYLGNDLIHFVGNFLIFLCFLYLFF